MDQIMNTHQYPKHLLEKYTDICAFNAYKTEYIEKILSDDRFREEHKRKEYLVNVNDYPIAHIRNFIKLLSDEDGRMNRLPDYVVEQITEAIGSINLFPDPLTMKEAGDDHVLSATYIDENKDGSTEIILEYTFNKKVREFEGYFGQSVENERWLPDYKVIYSPDHTKMFITAKYKNNSSLNVNIKCHHYIKVSPDHFPKELQNCLTNRSLFNAVLRRIFPTRAHYCKSLINEIIADGLSDFRNYMSLTPLNWVRYSNSKRPNYNLYINYILSCYRTNESRPIVDDMLTYEDKIKAMEMLIKDYPYFTIHDQSQTDCELDLWERYFKEDLTKELADEMNLSDRVAKHLITYYCSDPEKYSKIIELFPGILEDNMFTDFKFRLRHLIKKKKHVDGCNFNYNTTISSDDAIHFNRLPSTLPVRWRFYLCGGTLSCPDSESSQIIIEKMRNNIPPANAIEKVNYMDIRNGKYVLLPEHKMQIFIAPYINGMNTLHPEHLEQEFQSYRFSETYKTAPTEMDSLAVRFSNVYKGMGYNVPEIPDDFLDRLNNLEEPEKADESELNCTLCKKRTQSHMFPSCGHTCVCELCSYALLNCPECGYVGNPYPISS